jgi:lipopolysaccharide export LptBFGC system permease protein LptF
MNTAQIILVAVPALLLYGWFVLKAESGDRVNHLANAIAGVFFVPLLLFLMPLIALVIASDVMRKPSGKRLVPLVIVALLWSLYGGIGVGLYVLRDRPMPSAQDLPVER